MDRTSLETDTYWVATVVMASGPLLLLRYDGYDDDRSGDFWCDAASDDLQPIGWCARNNTILIPPAGRKQNERSSLFIPWRGDNPCFHIHVRVPSVDWNPDPFYKENLTLHLFVVEMQWPHS